MRSIIVIAAVLFAAISEAGGTYSNETTTYKDAKLYLQIYGHFADTIYVSGTSGLEWSDEYYTGGYYYIDMEMTSIDLVGELSGYYNGISIHLDTSSVSYGQTKSKTPSAMFPADSFFDLYIKCTIPDIFPGDTLYTPSLHIESEINQMPSYFVPYLTLPYSIVILYNGGSPVGEIRYWEEDAVPYAIPEARIVKPVPRISNQLSYIDTDTLQVTVSLAGGPVPANADFKYRLAGTADPFQLFWSDNDGTAPMASTTGPAGSGDGWSGYLDVSSFPGAGEFYDFEASLFVPGTGQFRDTITFFVDPSPCIPEILSIPEDSVGYIQPDDEYHILYSVEDSQPESTKVFVFPCPWRVERTLTPVNQHRILLRDSRGILATEMACVSSAAASCLKYFADNGYDELDDDADGNANKMARELGKEMDTSSETGTSTDNTTSGINGYLDNHGQNSEDWDVEYKEMGPWCLESLFNDFAADSEDVLLWLADTSSSGEVGYHVVTMESSESESYLVQHESGCVSGGTNRKVGFMDPNGGYSEEHDIKSDDAGNITTEGYSFLSGGGDAYIHGWLKVSPPADEGSDGSRNFVKRAESSTRRLINGPADRRLAGTTLEFGQWIEVDSGPTTGDSQPDSLFWDTTGFPEGIYLLKVITENIHGLEGYDLRVCSIIDTTVTGMDDPMPEPRDTGLKGAYPNPFNPTTRIDFTLSRESRVTLSIHDPAGRLVRCLLGGELLEAREHSIMWDGLNDLGKPVASGVYICSLKACGNLSSLKLILLR